MDQSKTTVLAVAFLGLLAACVTVTSILILSGGKVYQKIPKTFPMSTKFPDGTSKTYNALLETEVIVLERTPLDPNLFEVPSQYKRVEPNHEN